MTEVKKTDNFMMRTWLETVQSIVGPNGLKSVLNYGHLEKYIDNFPPNNDLIETPVEDARNLFLSLYELFGKKGSKSLSLRAGREFARIGIEGRSGLVKALLVAARLAPEKKKMHLLLKKLVETGNEWFTSDVSGPIIELQEDDNYFFIVHKDRFESDGVTSQEPICNIYTGMITYLMEWITGHEHEVKEIECRAMGYPADVFRIEKAHKEKKG